MSNNDIFNFRFNKIDQKKQKYMKNKPKLNWKNRGKYQNMFDL